MLHTIFLKCMARTALDHAGNWHCYDGMVCQNIGMRDFDDVRSSAIREYRHCATPVLSMDLSSDHPNNHNN